MVTKEYFDKTAYHMSYAEYRVCYCPDCKRADCKHREAYRRLPNVDGGLGLCPNLMFATGTSLEGVIVERNGKINIYKNAESAIAELEHTAGCESIIMQLRRGKVFCSDVA